MYARMHFKMIKSWRLNPTLNSIVDTWHILVYLLITQDKEQIDEGSTVKSHLLFPVWKFYLGLAYSNFCNNLLYFGIQCLQKWTCQHFYSCPFGGRELVKSRGALRSPTAHLAPSAFVLGERQPAQIIKLRTLMEVLCSKFSHILGWRTPSAHFPC